MDTNKLKLTWGDSIIVDKDAPKQYNPSEIGSVCGFRIIDTEKLSEEFNSPIGTKLFLIEFSSGVSKEIPEIFLLKRTI